MNDGMGCGVESTSALDASDASLGIEKDGTKRTRVGKRPDRFGNVI